MGNKNYLITLKEILTFWDRTNFDEYEKEMWNETVKFVDHVIDPNDYGRETSTYHEDLICYYLRELKNFRENYPHSFALERAASREIAKNYRELGCMLKIEGDLERSIDAYQKAVFWYQLIDENIGFLTELHKIQGDCAYIVFTTRKEANLFDEVTNWFEQHCRRIMYFTVFRKHEKLGNIPEIDAIMEEIKQDIERGYAFDRPFDDFEFNSEDTDSEVSTSLDEILETSDLIEITDEINA